MLFATLINRFRKTFSGRSHSEKYKPKKKKKNSTRRSRRNQSIVRIKQFPPVKTYKNFKKIYKELIKSEKTFCKLTKSSAVQV